MPKQITFRTHFLGVVYLLYPLTDRGLGLLEDATLTDLNVHIRDIKGPLVFFHHLYICLTTWSSSGLSLNSPVHSCVLKSTQL